MTLAEYYARLITAKPYIILLVKNAFIIITRRVEMCICFVIELIN